MPVHKICLKNIKEREKKKKEKKRKEKEALDETQ